MDWLPLTEKELRQKIYEEILSVDLKEAREISPEYYSAAMRTRLICALIAKKGK